MAFFPKTRSTNKITPLDQKFTLRKIRLVFLFLNLFSHMKNLFSVYYQFKKILQQRKVIILSLRTFWSKNITVQKISWYIPNKNLTEFLKHRGVLYVLSLLHTLQIAGFFKRQLRHKQNNLLKNYGFFHYF